MGRAVRGTFDLADALRTARQRQGLSQDTVARRIGRRYGWDIGRFEHGECRITPEMRDRLERVLGPLET